MFKNNLIKALLGGFIGTIVFTVMGQFIAPHIIGFPMNIGKMIAGMIHSPENVGVMIHFVMGTILFPISYLLLGYNRIPGPGWLKGLLYLLPIYLVAMIVIVPMAGKGLFFDSFPAAMIALMGHLIYGVIMGAIIGTPKKA
ncbi:hypothetical protein UB37_00165 [Photobacterium iliopiscarium]|jgi:hypothetical protein|uniref:DUF1440 domain-containing protein n=1 Tax=Photobacterium iliopiscarium TaxID=56192 RepID=A0A0D8Q798_9GAMM|nr:DUF6789 family protein [Photobacterium iliopiscarium]KJG13902.1 hypothetical protein UB38_06335 [Photobacterium iliopiscarium]KJG26700.1 hypothetical protein UB37_00165 [Photobacterium iliopiscarium]PST99941.1 hypothetical protein C9I85_08540 [Photobacterium iliopiscarium]PSV85173.1 hypothetical protein C9J51_02575 [Photobacterium iliopiscarium]PSV95599.1 hypothetical protein C9I88_13140 [Photobacterium iliopiscarium]